MQVLCLGRAPRTKETLPDFLKWRRVTRRPLVFRGLTGSKRTPGFRASQLLQLSLLLLHLLLHFLLMLFEVKYLFSCFLKLQFEGCICDLCPKSAILNPIFNRF